MARSKRICIVEGCQKFVFGHGYCSTHYSRWRKHGDPLVVTMAAHGDPMAFYQGVVLSHDKEECLFWPFARGKNGYASFQHDGKVVNVHRQVCIAARGEPPSPKHEAAHRCGKGDQGCVSPQCLYWASRSQNTKDRYKHAQQRGQISHLAKLTRENILEIRLMRGGMTTAQVAQKFGVSWATIYDIYAGRTWSWLK